MEYASDTADDIETAGGVTHRGKHAAALQDQLLDALRVDF